MLRAYRKTTGVRRGLVGALCLLSLTEVLGMKKQDEKVNFVEPKQKRQTFILGAPGRIRASIAGLVHYRNGNEHGDTCQSNLLQVPGFEHLIKEVPAEFAKAPPSIVVKGCVKYPTLNGLYRRWSVHDKRPEDSVNEWWKEDMEEYGAKWWYEKDDGSCSVIVDGDNWFMYDREGHSYSLFFTAADRDRAVAAPPATGWEYLDRQWKPEPILVQVIGH